MSTEESTIVKYNNFTLELNTNPAEFRFVYSCCNGKPPNVNTMKLDRWVMRSLDGHAFGYILADHDSELKETEILDAQIFSRFKMGPLQKAIRTVSSGRLYGQEQTICALSFHPWTLKHVLRRAGFEQFDPEEEWAGPDSEYFIYEV